MNTQPQFPNPGPQAPPERPLPPAQTKTLQPPLRLFSHRSLLSAHSFPTPSSRRPRPGPSSTQSPIPTVVPRQTQPPSSSTLPSSRHAHPRSSSPGTSPSSTDSPLHPKNRLKLSLASRPPLGAGWPERAPPFSPRHADPPRPTVTLTLRTPKAREGCADGRRNHRPRG